MRVGKLRVGLLSAASASALLIAVIWGSGLLPSAWFTTAKNKGATVVTEVPSSPEVVSTARAPLGTVASSAGTDSSISSTPQPLFLLATAPGRNSREGSASIGTSVENPQTYIAGALLANGARLQEVHKDFVLLGRGSETLRLDLYRRDRPAAKAVSDLAMVAAANHEPPKITTRLELTDFLRPSPVFDGAVQRGYEVYPGARTHVFGELGLMGGDVLTSIDGMPLTDAQSSMDVFEQLLSGAALSATVLRKGTVIIVTLDGAVIQRAREAASAPATALVAPPTQPSI